MLYSRSHRLAFVHIQKTGGSSLRRLLTDAIPDMSDMPELPGPHHPTRELFAALHRRGEDPLSIRVLSLIRDPLHQVVSIYRYWRSDGLSPEDRAQPLVQAAMRQSFPEFVETTITGDDYAHMLLVDGALPPNVEVIRFEEALQDVDILREATGIPSLPALPHERSTDVVNTSDPSPSRDGLTAYYDERTEGLVRRAYSWTYGSGFYL